LRSLYLSPVKQHALLTTDATRIRFALVLTVDYCFWLHAQNRWLLVSKEWCLKGAWAWGHWLHLCSFCEAAHIYRLEILFINCTCCHCQETYSTEL